jgi:prepilin-type N-terminal cleavage/methylation domain-containing protein
MKKAFTIVELLVVMAIIGILCTITFPVIARSRDYAQQHSAMMGLRQLGPAVKMYMSDADEAYPPSGYWDGDRFIAWYGVESEEGKVIPDQGIIASYRGKVVRDPTHRAQPYRGDMSGFGYNWGFLGSHAYGYLQQGMSFDRFRPAMESELEEPSQTIAFATSVLYKARWNEGDGLYHDYGFIDPPFAWHGAPTVDFRHGGEKKVNEEAQEVESTGVALVQFTDGSVKPMRLGQMTNQMFMRHRTR